jgi:hypothetical protein
MERINTITAGELIELLSDLDEDTPVAFACNYGDRCRTKQIIGIQGCVDEEPIYETAYSESGWAVRKYEDDNGEETLRHFIIT